MPRDETPRPTNPPKYEDPDDIPVWSQPRPGPPKAYVLPQPGPPEPRAPREIPTNLRPGYPYKKWRPYLNRIYDSGAPSYLSAFITIPLLWYPTPGLPKPITFAYAGFNAFAGIMASYDYPLDGALTTFSWSLLYALTNGSRKVWRLMLEEQRGRDLPRVKYAGMWAYGSGQRAVGGTGLKGLGVTTYRWGCVVSVLNVVWGAGAGWYWWGGRKRGDKDRVWEDGIQDKWA